MTDKNRQLRLTKQEMANFNEVITAFDGLYAAWYDLDDKLSALHSTIEDGLRACEDDDDDRETLGSFQEQAYESFGIDDELRNMQTHLRSLPSRYGIVVGN